MKNKILSIIGISLLLGFNAPIQAQSLSIPTLITYGQNSPDWNQKYGMTGTHSNCDPKISNCLERVKVLLKSQKTNYFILNLPKDPSKILDYAKQYSASNTPGLYELAIDDFSGTFNNDWCPPDKACKVDLEKVITAIKSNNPNLKFGVTIYVDELSDLLKNPHITPLLSLIDKVHLYAHFATDGLIFEDYVKQVKDNFPNAGIVLGAYTYDRINYISCAPSCVIIPPSQAKTSCSILAESQPLLCEQPYQNHRFTKPSCSHETQLELYKQTLSIQWKLLQEDKDKPNKNKIESIEFYPGFFGLEDKYDGWNNPEVCCPQRKGDCIKYTKEMHEATTQLFNHKSASNPE